MIRKAKNQFNINFEDQNPKLPFSKTSQELIGILGKNYRGGSDSIQRCIFIFFTNTFAPVIGAVFFTNTLAPVTGAATLHHRTITLTYGLTFFIFFPLTVPLPFFFCLFAVVYVSMCIYVCVCYIFMPFKKKFFFFFV